MPLLMSQYCDVLGVRYRTATPTTAKGSQQDSTVCHRARHQLGKRHAAPLQSFMIALAETKQRSA
jgi:hypothetical protein